MINEELNKWAKTFRVRRESEGGNQPARKTVIGFTKTGGGGAINVGRTIDFEID